MARPGVPTITAVTRPRTRTGTGQKIAIQVDLKVHANVGAVNKLLVQEDEGVALETETITTADAITVATPRRMPGMTAHLPSRIITRRNPC